MSGRLVDRELWEAVLGPSPDDGFDGYSPLDRSSWPPETVGLSDGVFWHRWIEARLITEVTTVEAAKALRVKLRRELHTGDLQAVAMNPEKGVTKPIPPEAWQATGDPGRALWWSGTYWAFATRETPDDVFILEPQRATAPASRKRQSDKARVQNMDARIIYV